MNVHRALAACLVLALAACAHAPPKKDVVWPDPPDTARIRFVSAFKHSDDLDTSGFARFRRALLGGAPDAALNQPMGLAVSDDGNRLYIANFGGGHLMVADFEHKTLKAFAPDEPMIRPFGVALDASERVYLSDSGAQVVRVYEKNGDPVMEIGRNQLERPTGIALDRAHGRLYVSDSSRKKSDNHRVRVFDLAGKWLGDLGAQEGRPGKGDADGQWYFPTYIALDGEGNVYVADTMNFRIQVFNPKGEFVRKFGENGDGPGTFARLKGIDFDGFGNIYVVDGGHSNVQIFNKDLAVLMFFGGYAQKLEYFDVPSAIAIDRKRNRIYVCNEFISRINVYELINTQPADSVAKPEAKSATAQAAP